MRYNTNRMGWAGIVTIGPSRFHDRLRSIFRGAADAPTKTRANSGKQLARFWLAISISGMALFAPPAINAQACANGGINVGCLSPGAACSPVDTGGGTSGRCKTSLPVGERECNCVGTPIPSIDPRCGDRTAKGKFDCRINRPPVNNLETPIPDVVFAPGDIVQVKADGCVQTGGFGNTWKRYVNPTGGDSDRLYHGLIRIPTGTKNSDLVPINTVIGRDLRVTGLGLPVSQLALSLGYSDNDYSGNGYDGHDDGTEDQCRDDPAKGNDGGPAHVTVTIYRGVPPSQPASRFNFDVLPRLGCEKAGTCLDPNGLLYNPQWSWQQRPENLGMIPITALCHNFSMRDSHFGIPNLFLSPNFPDCTDQADTSTVDQGSGTTGDLCNDGATGGDAFAGHVNWFPVTVEGRTGKVNHSRLPFPLGDDDYTFTFHIGGENGNDDTSLSVNHAIDNPGADPGLHVEFNAGETIQFFKTKEWRDLKDDVDNGGTSSEGQATTRFEGHAILTGMFGLDGEHGLKAELHPLYAMANLRNNFENTPGDEAWLIFVRNQGGEGYCSSRSWPAGFQDYTFRLPWRPGMTSVTVDRNKTQFDGTAGTSGPSVVAVRPGITVCQNCRAPAASGVYVTFHLGPPASSPLINGALHLIWKGPRIPGGGISAPVASTQGAVADEDEPETKIRAAFNQLPPAQQAQIIKALASAATPGMAMHRLPQTGPVKIATQPPETPKVLEWRAIDGGPATGKIQRDAAQMRALCAATNNAPPGLPASVCGSK